MGRLGDSVGESRAKYVRMKRGYGLKEPRPVVRKASFHVRKASFHVNNLFHLHDSSCTYIQYQYCSIDTEMNYAHFPGQRFRKT
jgi:hypothetical protein